MEYREILRRLESTGIDFTVHEHEPILTVADAEARLPFPAGQFLKTLVFAAGLSYVLVALRGRDQVDYRRLADALGVRRHDLTQPSPAEIETALGMERGGVGPLSPRGNVRVLVDTGALGLRRVYCGIGRCDRTLEIGMDDLLRLTGAQVFPLTKDPGC